MTEEWPYNLPIWQRSLRLPSPDGTVVADIPETMEVSMGNPTIGTLVLSTGFEIENCNPSFVWSDDSTHLAVPQYSRHWLWGIGRQRLLVINAISGKAWLSRKLAYYIQPESFCDQEITVVLDPFRKNKKSVTYAMTQVLADFTTVSFARTAAQATPEDLSSQD